MSELAQHTTDYGIVESEPPEQLGRNLTSAGHLLASATAFFFLAFVFAYFYLRSLNNAGLWHPKHVDPSQALGALVDGRRAWLAAVLVRWGLADHRAERRPAWRIKGAIALAVGIAAVVLQVVEWTTARVRARRRRLRERVLRLDGLLRRLPRRSALLAGDHSGDVDPLPRLPGRRRRTVAPGEAAGDPDRTGDDIRRPALARPRRARGALVLLGLPRRASACSPGSPLPRLAAAVVDASRADHDHPQLLERGAAAPLLRALRLPVLARGAAPGLGAARRGWSVAGAPGSSTRDSQRS